MPPSMTRFGPDEHAPIGAETGISDKREGSHWPASQRALSPHLRSRIEADNDHQAVLLWLTEYRDSPQTLKSYRREAERLLLWLASQDKRLPDMNRELLRQFEAFLENP